MKQADKYNAPVEAENLAKLFNAYHATAAHGKGRMEEAAPKCTKKKKKPAQARGQADEQAPGEADDEQPPGGTDVEQAPGETDVEQAWTSMGSIAGGLEVSTP